MASTITSSDACLLQELDWDKQDVAFHNNKGKNVELSEKDTIVSRVKGATAVRGIVFTREPLSIGQIFQVDILQQDFWGTESANLRLGFTGEDPSSSILPLKPQLVWDHGLKHLLTVCKSVHYNGKHCGTFNSLNFAKSIGILLTNKGDLHICTNKKWSSAIHLDNYPLNRPMWGVVEMIGGSRKMKAVTWTVGSTYPPYAEKRMMDMGLLKGNEEARLEPQNKQDIDKPAMEANVIQQLEESLKLEMQDKLQLLQRNITRQLQQQTAGFNHLFQEMREVIASGHHHCQLDCRGNQQEEEFWQVSPEEVSIRENEIIGQGAWGNVTKGSFRGTTVAVKRPHREIVQGITVETIRREIRTMAQIRHPNLVLFVAAVLNEQTGPMIVTELLDTSLRSAYQDDRVGPNKRRIFGDISSALVYLHRQREPVIHRDVSSANVLLLSLPNDKWLAKLSDFGSANLARDATTPGPGAILYTAPEAYPRPPMSPQPQLQQTTKIDVYSFGVLTCEVVNARLPEAAIFQSLLMHMEGVWPELHPLITSCVSHSPQDRPSMDTVLQHIKQLNWEP